MAKDEEFSIYFAGLCKPGGSPLLKFNVFLKKSNLPDFFLFDVNHLNSLLG